MEAVLVCLHSGSLLCKNHSTAVSSHILTNPVLVAVRLRIQSLSVQAFEVHELRVPLVGTGNRLVFGPLLHDLHTGICGLPLSGHSGHLQRGTSLCRSADTDPIELFAQRIQFMFRPDIPEVEEEVRRRSQQDDLANSVTQV